MINELSKVNIYFKDSLENNKTFVELSTTVDEKEVSKLFVCDSLNMEAIGAFKKTPLVALIDRAVSYVTDKYTSSIVNRVTRLIAFILLSLVDPSFIKTAKRLNIFDGEIFTDIEPMFLRDQFGKMYFTKKQIEIDLNEEDIDNLLIHLMNEKFITVKDEKYFINNEFVLMGVKITS
jgi:hypothetical protein